MASSKQQQQQSMDLDACEKLANRLENMTDLPMACHNYPSVVRKVRNKQERALRGDVYLGMHAGAAVQARASKARGDPHFAQVQRRRTAGYSKSFDKKADK